VSDLRVLAVAGCRPNFVKLAPLLAEISRRPGIEASFVHTGQHYDADLSDVFLRELEIPEPDVWLGVGSGSHAAQTARALEGIERVLLELEPDVVLVPGDVNSTLAAALAAAKLGFPVAHVEAGLRSFDREMPEEINRVLTDAISDLLFVTEGSAIANLRREGVQADRIHRVGNVMVDALVAHRGRIAGSGAVERLGLEPRRYAVLTLHRPENVDDPGRVAPIVAAIERLAGEIAIVFPVHPRSRAGLSRGGALARLEAAGVRLQPPLGYLDFLRLVELAAFVMTDSGGLQEESTALAVPCLTLRRSTERPATVFEGTNRLVGNDPEVIVAAARQALAGEAAEPRLPELWDGRAAVRIVDTLLAEAPRLRQSYSALRARTTCESRLRRSA
jgi:UDP-N-acetylglucosamine 2-epimerase (non-hydrolysing)